jgi:hypothetical protein
LGLEQQDLCDVTTTANALIAAYQANVSQPGRAILVHMGAQTTIVVALLAGQAAFASSFQMGGDFLTRSLARARNCSEEAAEALKYSTNLLSGPESEPQLVGAVEGWVAELNRQLKEWFERKPELRENKSGFELFASGAGFDQPGLAEFLKSRAELNLQPWPRRDTEAPPPEGFEVAFGGALQALGHTLQPVSLLPDEYRLRWQKRKARQQLELASFLLVLVCILVFALGTWNNLGLITRKEALLTKIQAAQDAVRANDALTADLVTEYDAVRPFFAAAQNTLDTLKTLALLQQSRSNRPSWYVLVADQQTYFTQPLPSSSTNKPPHTNLVSQATAPWLLTSPFAGPMAFWTNLSPAQPGIIAELCIPEEAEAGRKVLGQIVRELQQQRLFANADLLPEDLRRALADPKVTLPDRQFSLKLDFAETDFQRQAYAKRNPGGNSSRPPRRAPRPAAVPAESAESGSQSLK